MPPGLPCTGVTQGTETCRFTTHPAPGKGLPAHISKNPPCLSQGHLGRAKPTCKGRELPGFPSILPSPIPAKSQPLPQYHHSPPSSQPQTQLGAQVYIKSRVYCHFYLDLHNSVTASDIKSNVPSRPREQARDRGAQEHGLVLPPQWARAQLGLWLCPVLSPDPPSAAARFCHVGCQRGVNLSPPWCHSQ